MPCWTTLCENELLLIFKWLATIQHTDNLQEQTSDVKAIGPWTKVKDT